MKEYRDDHFDDSVGDHLDDTNNDFVDNYLEEARTRTGTRRRLQTRVSRPCTPIQGKSRQYLS